MSKKFFDLFTDYREIALRYDPHLRAIWCYYNPRPRPCFSDAMLKELRQLQQKIIDYFENKPPDEESRINYVVLHSQVPGIFSMGGDLALFTSLIKEQNRPKLLEYAKRCIDVCYLNAVNLHLPVTTISLVEGVALGGGFESALSSNVLIATRDAEMGFPEIRFNLFPGMGAFSLLARRCGPGIAERLISSGDTYSAEKLYDLGVVHRLCEAGQGVECVENYILQHQKLANGHHAIREAGKCYQRVDYRELEEITTIWVDAALRLRKRDLKLMEKLVKAQTAKIVKTNGKSIIRTKHDRRFHNQNLTFPLKDWSGNIVMFDRRKKSDRRLPINKESLLSHNTAENKNLRHSIC